MLMNTIFQKCVGKLVTWNLKHICQQKYKKGNKISKLAYINLLNLITL